MKVHILNTGEVLIDRALAYQELGLHPFPFTGWFRGKKKKICVPVSSYLIEHPQGLILVDTGWHEKMRMNQRKHLGTLAYSMFRGELPIGHSIIEQLHSLGIDSKDLDLVILSHMHADHVSGLAHVCHARKILVSELEWHAAQRKIGYIKHMWDNISIDTFKFSDIPYGPYNKGCDLFGDGTLYLVHTPGHSDGMVSLLVQMKQGWLVLASDVGYSERSWKEMILPGLTTDKRDAYNSLKWLHDFSKEKQCMKVIANHDPNIVSGIIE